MRRHTNKEEALVLDGCSSAGGLLGQGVSPLMLCVTLPIVHACLAAVMLSRAGSRYCGTLWLKWLAVQQYVSL